MTTVIKVSRPVPPLSNTSLPNGAEVASCVDAGVVGTSAGASDVSTTVIEGVPANLAASASDAIVADEFSIATVAAAALAGMDTRYLMLVEIWGGAGHKPSGVPHSRS
jgi:hypothetical protein